MDVVLSLGNYHNNVEMGSVAFCNE